MNKMPWLVCLLSASSIASPPPGGGKVIYGEDDRLNLYQVTNSRDASLADSTVALMESGNLTRNGEKFEITAEKFGKAFNLCAAEPYFEEPSGAFCSGALVGDDLVITAGHCIKSADQCAETKFVFNYSVTKEGDFPTSTSVADVVGCKEIIDRKQEATGADYALIRLDRKITDHQPLKINRTADLKAGDKVGVIGHPSGLPVKVAFGDSMVRSVEEPGFFMANLDTYGGNSGSAVFNTQTGLIEGILVRGETDFVYANGCRVSKVCTSDACRGEDVTKISELATLIPTIGGSSEPPESPTGGSGSRWPTASRRPRN